jgi:hypothetical protein
MNWAINASILEKRKTPWEKEVRKPRGTVK